MTDTAAIDREQDLRDQVDQALEQATVKPTAKNRKALKQAQEELEQYLQENSVDQVGGREFKSILEVVDYLIEENWKIGKSAAYDHWKKESKLNANPDGTFALAEVERYAREYLEKKDGSKLTRNLAQEKQAAEIRQKNADAQLRELKLRAAMGELIPRSRVETELSERATNLKNYFDAIARSSAGRIIKIVKGDPQLAPELISFLLGLNRKAFDNYSRDLDLGDEED